MISVFQESGFPTVDAMPWSWSALQRSLTSAGPIQKLTLQEILQTQLTQTKLFVLPYGSAFPKALWAVLWNYLNRGGNLLYVGGRPFELPCLKQNSHWRKEIPQTAYHQSLGIEQLNEIDSSRIQGTEIADELKIFEIKNFPKINAFALMTRFTEIDDEERCGATGPMDAELHPLVWGVDEAQRRISCPISMIDHYQGRFKGGRWVFLSARLPKMNVFFEKLLLYLAQVGLQKPIQIQVRPEWACYYPGEQPALIFWARAFETQQSLKCDIQIQRDHQIIHQQTIENEVTITSNYQVIPLSFQVEPGFYHLQSTIEVEGHYRTIQHQGFWGWDTQWVRQAPQISVNDIRFMRNGHTIPIVGTTYMAGDVSRKFLLQPNPAQWERDMDQMQRMGINTIRTGIWANHRQIMFDAGHPRNDSLRALDAYVLSSLKHEFWLQFTFFSFIPDVFPSDHPYLDSRARSLQREYLMMVIRRYANIPSISWDLINEPSVSHPKKLWKTRPLEGELERQAFIKFLKEIHRSLDELRERWNMTPQEISSWDSIQLPTELDFSEFKSPQEGLVHAGRAFDFQQFSQVVFREWVQNHVDTIRQISSQLVTVGQDEGGMSQRRPENHFFHRPLDFTCNHTWWENEDLIWGVTASKVKGKPFLVQETGVMFSDTVRRASRISEKDAGKLFERKVISSFMGGAGFIQWCFNVNAYMNNHNEIEIGAFRIDQTARPEAWVLESIGNFFKKAQGYLQEKPEPPSLGVLTSFSGLLSSRTWTEKAQRVAHRILSALRIPFHALSEWEFDQWDYEKAVLFPSISRIDPQAMEGWVRRSSKRNLWVSGPVAEDGYGRVMPGLSCFGIQEIRQAVNPQESVRMNQQAYALTYTLNKTYQVEKDISREARIHYFKTAGTSLYYMPLPLEANDQWGPILSFYQTLMHQNHIQPYCTLEGADLFEVTILPKRFSSTVLYMIFNEGSHDRVIRFQDHHFGFQASLRILAGRATLAVFDSRGKKLVQYQNPTF
jgi:hypothetical protein